MSDESGPDRPAVPDAPLSAGETLRSVQIADQYLAEVERVLWAAATHTTDKHAADTLESLTQTIWTIQNDLDELEGRLHAQTDGAPADWDWSADE